MAGKRKITEEFILEYFASIDKSGRNHKYYQEKFKSMSDAEFDRFMKEVRDGYTPEITIPNLDGVESVTMENNFKLAKKMGVEFHHHLVIEGEGDTPTYITPKKYLVIRLPVRRQAQHLYKKIRIPENNNTVDDLTGQPTGRSRGSSVSYPELQVLAALNLEATAVELMKYRGGDTGGFAAMNASVLETGAVQMSAIADKATGVESKQTLSVLLHAMHISNNV